MREQPNKKTFTLKLGYLYTQIIPDESFHSPASSATCFVSRICHTCNPATNDKTIPPRLSPSLETGKQGRSLLILRM